MLKKDATEEVKHNNDKTIKIKQINELLIKMLDKNARRVYTFAERKCCGLQTAAAGPCLQKISKSKTENFKAPPHNSRLTA